MRTAPGRTPPPVLVWLDPLAGKALVGIDEIDLHLHPRWQRTVLPQLTALFPNTQFILTTHSPIVVQAAIDQGFTVLRLTEMDGAVTAQRLSNRLLKALRGAEVGSLLLEEHLFDARSRFSVAYGELEKRADELQAKVSSGEATESWGALYTPRLRRLSTNDFAGHAEAVVRAAEFGWDAAARGAAGNFDLVAPSASARSAARASRRSLRIVDRRHRVVSRVVPVGAPFVHVLAHIVKPETIGRGGAHRLGSPQPAGPISKPLEHRLIAPRINLLLQPAARRKFPLGLRRQPER